MRFQLPLTTIVIELLLLLLLAPMALAIPTPPPYPYPNTSNTYMEPNTGCKKSSKTINKCGRADSGRLQCQDPDNFCPTDTQYKYDPADDKENEDKCRSKRKGDWCTAVWRCCPVKGARPPGVPPPDGARDEL